MNQFGPDSRVYNVKAVFDAIIEFVTPVSNNNNNSNNCISGSISTEWLFACPILTKNLSKFQFYYPHPITAKNYKYNYNNVFFG